MLITCGIWYIVTSLCHLHTNQKNERDQKPTAFLSEARQRVEETY